MSHNHEAMILERDKQRENLDLNEFSGVDWERTWEEAWKAAYKQCLNDYDLEDEDPDDGEYDEPSDDFPLYLEYPQEDEGMYLNERLYGEE